MIQGWYGWPKHLLGTVSLALEWITKSRISLIRKNNGHQADLESLDSNKSLVFLIPGFSRLTRFSLLGQFVSSGATGTGDHARESARLRHCVRGLPFPQSLWIAALRSCPRHEGIDKRLHWVGLKSKGNSVSWSTTQWTSGIQTPSTHYKNLPCCSQTQYVTIVILFLSKFLFIMCVASLNVSLHT